MAYFRCMGNENNPSANYDYYVENVDLGRGSHLVTDANIFNTANKSRSYQIDFKMFTDYGTEAAFIGTDNNANECNFEVYQKGSTSYFYLKGFIQNDSPLSQNINNKDVTILYDGTTGTFTFKIDNEIIDTFTFSSLPSSAYDPGYLNIGRYIGADTYYLYGYCYYFGFKWLS